MQTNEVGVDKHSLPKKRMFDSSKTHGQYNTAHRKNIPIFGIELLGHISRRQPTDTTPFLCSINNMTIDRKCQGIFYKENNLNSLILSFISKKCLSRVQSSQSSFSDRYDITASGNGTFKPNFRS